MQCFIVCVVFQLLVMGDNVYILYLINDELVKFKYIIIYVIIYNNFVKVRISPFLPNTDTESKYMYKTLIWPYFVQIFSP